MLRLKKPCEPKRRVTSSLSSSSTSSTSWKGKKNERGESFSYFATFASGDAIMNPSGRVRAHSTNHRVRKVKSTCNSLCLPRAERKSLSWSRLLRCVPINVDAWCHLTLFVITVESIDLFRVHERERRISNEEEEKNTESSFDKLYQWREENAKRNEMKWKEERKTRRSAPFVSSLFCFFFSTVSPLSSLGCWIEVALQMSVREEKKTNDDVDVDVPSVGSFKMKRKKKPFRRRSNPVKQKGKCRINDVSSRNK